ncbi:hypothetical protein JCM10212_005786 [Sporobolomyces blumeae]
MSASFQPSTTPSVTNGPMQPAATAYPSNLNPSASSRHGGAPASRTTASGRPSSSSGFKKALAAFGLGSSGAATTRNGSQPSRPPEGYDGEPRASGSSSKLGSRVEQVRNQGRRVMRYVKKKLNSKSPKEEIPKTWDEYTKAYANHEIDVDDPPLPPTRAEEDPADPTPFEQRNWNAPRPVNEVARQNVVNRLDLFGTRARAARSVQHDTIAEDVDSARGVPLTPTASSSAATPRRGSTTASIHSTAPSTVLDDGVSVTPSTNASIQPVEDSLENHPVFRSIVSRCREIFQTKVGLLTVLDDEQQLFLAAGGMPEGVDKLPRDVTFCSHAILGEEKGMVVLNTQDDWRFANNLPSTALGARFYAGVPLFARTAGHANAPSVAIGTLCVADDKPREEFTEAHRRVLRDLATQASNAIEAWATQRMSIKLARLHGAIPNASLPDLPKVVNASAGSTEVSLPTPPSSAGLPPAVGNASSVSLPAPRSKQVESGVSLPASPPLSLHRFDSMHSHSRHTSDTSEVSTVPSSVASKPQPFRRPATALAFAVTTEDPVSLVPRDLQKVFDTATKMLAKALDLDLVYLAALDLAIPTSQGGPTLRILSARGLPSPAPSFDPALHLKALRAPEGGLIYKNPRFVPNGYSSGTYASGILIPVLEVRRVGYVLCGYTQRDEREFVQRDLGYMVKFAEQLETACARLGRGDQLAAGLLDLDMARSDSVQSNHSSRVGAESTAGSVHGRY